MRLSIIIVSYNCRAHLHACLATLATVPPAVAHEIVVVDNGSTDGTSAAVRRDWPEVHVIDTGANVGFAKANNIGIRQSTGELILLLNPDTFVPAGAIDTLVATLDSRPDAAVVGPRLIDARGRAELSFGSMMSPLAELQQKMLVAGNDRGVPFVTAYVNRLTRRQREVDWVSGACLLVRRADAEAVGLMDERYFLYTEDVDFCAAIRAHRRAILFTPSAEIVHARGRSRASAVPAANRAYRASQLAFYGKHHPRWLPVLRAYLKLKGELPDK